jgi:hypothetical protein
VPHIAAVVALSISSQTAAAAEATPSENSIEHQIQALVPGLEEYISANMKSFDVPSLAIGIVAGNSWSTPKALASVARAGPGRHADLFSDRIGDQGVSFHDDGDRRRPGQAALG